MTQEVFRIVRGMDLKSIETQLALQCAPLITGIKISNLLIVPKEMEPLVRALLRKTGISCYRLLDTGEKMTFLLFRREQLAVYLDTPGSQEVLRRQGYRKFSLGGILAVFQSRYQAYKKGEESFPHEMGVLLGYPIEDVTGFIENKGKNYLYSGYWKVYGNVQEKIRLFEGFQEAKERLIRLLDSGFSMEWIIQKYNKNELRQAVV